MSSVSEIRQHIKAVGETAKITRAMHLISSAKMKRAMALHDRNNFYLNRVVGGIRYIIDNSDDFFPSCRYCRAPGDGHTAALGVSAGDKGLCGAFNSDVIKLAHRVIEEHPDEKPLVYAIGHMAAEHFSRITQPVLDYVHLIHEPNLQNARELAFELLAKYHSHEIDEIHVIYTNLIRLGMMEPVARHLLPLTAEDFAGTDYTWINDEMDFALYPSEEQVFDRMVPSYLIGVLYSAMVESFVSEQFSRMTAMEASMKNADEMLAKLELELNHARQSMITQEITEIISGGMLYNG